MKFRPCIDIRNNRVTQIVGGTLQNGTAGIVENFVSNRGAAYYAEMFKRDKLTGGHVIMLGPNNESAALEALHAYPGGLQIGGGITADNAAFWLEHGATHVIVTSYVFKDGRIDWHNLDELITAVGKEKLVLDLSCKKKGDSYFVVTDRWSRFTDLEINRTNLNQLESYCDEFLIHGVDVEGQCRGVQTELVALLGDWVLIPTTYAGGTRSLDDLALVNKLGHGKLDLTIGSALDIFGGNLPYSEVINWRPTAE